MEGEKGKTSTEKWCHTQPEEDWKLRKPLLVKTSVHPRNRNLQGGSVRKKSADRAWDLVVSSTNDLVSQPINMWRKPWICWGMRRLNRDHQLDSGKRQAYKNKTTTTGLVIRSITR